MFPDCDEVILLCLQSTVAVVTESQTYKKRADFLSNDDYAVYVRENVQVRLTVKPAFG